MSGSLNRNTAAGVSASIVLWGLIIAMLIFTSIRTIHLLQLTFPPDQQYVAYLGLAAFDVGVLGWFFYATQKARGASQRAVSYGMIFVCAAGVILATVADFFYQASANGITTLPPQLVTVGIWGVIIVVCLNFLAGIVVHLVDPAHLQRSKEEQLHDKIIMAAHNHMDTMTDEIAPQIASVLAEEWRHRVTAELIGKLPQGSIALPAAAPAPQIVQGSGHTVNAAAPKKEAVLAQTAPAQSGPSLLDGLVGGIKNVLNGDRNEPEPVQSAPRGMKRPLPHHRARSRGFMATPTQSGADDPKKSNGVPGARQDAGTRNSSTPSTGSNGNKPDSTRSNRRGRTRQS